MKLVAASVFIALIGVFPNRAAASSCPNTFTDSCKCPSGCTASDSCERICRTVSCLETGAIYQCSSCLCDTTIGSCRDPLKKIIGAALSVFASVADAAEPSQGTRRDFSNEHGDFLVLDRKAMDRINGSAAGVGVGVAVNKDSATVSNVVENGPAATAGLAAGDELISIDGRRVGGKTPSQISAELRGKDGTLVVLVIKSKKTGKKTKVSLIRSEDALNAAARSKIGGDVVIQSYELSTLGAADCPSEKGGCRFLYQDGGACRYTCPTPSKGK